MGRDPGQADCERLDEKSKGEKRDLVEVSEEKKDIVRRRGVESKRTGDTETRGGVRGVSFLPM